MRTISLIFILLCANAQAAIKYLNGVAGGSQSGNDWTNAYINIGQLETGLARGDTGYVADGTYGTATWNTPASGAALITIKKATIADHGTSTGWSNAFGDGQAVFNGSHFIDTPYWVFDGQTGGGPGQWKTNFGFKVITPATFSNGGFRINNVNSDITIRHVEIQGHGDDDSFPTAERDHGITSWLQNADRVTVSYAYIHDTGGLPLMVPGTRNSLYEYIYTGYYESVTAHAETIQFDASSGSTVRYCIIGRAHSTGGIICHGSDFKIYGNVFYNDGTMSWNAPNGVIGAWTAAPQQVTNSVAFNNTFVNLPAGAIPFAGGGASGGNQVRNNYFYLCPSNPTIGGPWSNPTVTHNHWQSSGGGSTQGTSVTTGSGDPFVAGTLTALEFRLASNTTAGQALAAPYNVDMNGNTRTTWTRGAIEFSGVDSTLPLLLAAPNGVIVQSDGLTWRFTFTETVTTSGAGWSTSMSGGAVTLSSFSAAGNVITATGSRQVDGGEFGTVSYVQPGNGVQDAAGNDLASLSGFVVTNQAIVNQVATPSIPLASGYYYGTQNVTITTATSGATIYYTLDGSTPTTGSNVYTGPIPISSPVTLQTFATKSGMGNSTIAGAAYQIGTWRSDNDFQNILGIPQQTGLFTWSFRVTTAGTNVASHIGLSPTTVDEFDDWAVIIRLNNIDSSFDVRNGDNYEKLATVTYAADVNYDVVVVVDIPNHKVVSVSVAPAGGSPTTIATNYNFRTSQLAATELDGVGMLTTVSIQPTVVTNMSFVAGVPGGGGAGVVPSASNLMISDP